MVSKKIKVTKKQLSRLQRKCLICDKYFWFGHKKRVHCWDCVDYMVYKKTRFKNKT